MPPARVSETRKNTTELSEELCHILNLRKLRPIFKNIEKEIHKLVDQHFDLTVPSSMQPQNMQAFVQKMTVEYFPGHFSATKNNIKDRIAILEAYVGTYIDENLLEPRRNIDKKRSEFRPKIIIVKRPPSRPFYSSPKKKKAPIFETPIVTPLLPSPPIDSDPPEYSPTDVFDGQDHSDSDADDCPIIGGGKRRTCFVVPSPPPSRSSSPAPIPTDIDIDIDIGLDLDLDPITDFCNNCCPSMRDRAEALRRTGATQKADLIGMAQWQDETLQNFLRSNKVAQTPLEEQAFMIGFNVSVLKDTLRPASAMSL